MSLTRHFSLFELTRTDTGLDNTPGPRDLDNLLLLAGMLERVRAVLGDQPIAISSGYRSAEVNARVGGSPNSAHRHGLAADFTCRHYGTPRDICEALIAAGLAWDQLILEFPTATQPGGQWVHIGLPILGKPRRQVLTALRRNRLIHYATGLARS